MEQHPKVCYYYINLDGADERRESAEQQGRQFHLPLCRVSASCGEDTRSAAHYDRARRHKEYANDLLPGEHGCTLSHMRVLQRFMQEEGDFAVVLEDDFLLHPDFNDGIRWLTEKTSGWEVVKLFTDEGKLYPLHPRQEGCPWSLVFPKTLPWVSVGTLYTRKGAQAVLDSFRRYWLPFDVQWAWNLLFRKVPVCGIAPGLVLTKDAENKDSTIGTKEERNAITYKAMAERTLLQRLWHRMSVWKMSRGKKHMRQLMKKRIRIEP